jgi:hypothetical protein
LKHLLPSPLFSFFSSRVDRLVLKTMVIAKGASTAVAITATRLLFLLRGGAKNLAV